MDDGTRQLRGAEARDQPFFQMTDLCTVNQAKSTAFITTVAIAVLSSAYLAYQNSARWWLTTSCISIVNLYVLPKILHSGHPKVIRMALVTNLAIVGSLALGGIGVATVFLSQNIFTLLKTYQFSEALFKAFLMTGFLGHGIPLFHRALKKAYHFLYTKEWQKRISDLSKPFQHMPEIGLGFLQTNFWGSLTLHLSLFKPELILNFYQFFNVKPPPHVWLMAAATGEISLSHFQYLIASMEQKAYVIQAQEDEQFDAQIQEKIKSEENKGNDNIYLKNVLSSMKKEMLGQAIPLLLSTGSKLIPYVLSNEQFLNLFVGEVLSAANITCQQFLDSIHSWQDLHKRYQQLKLNLAQLQKELKTQEGKKLAFKREESFLKRHQEYSKEFSKIRAELEKIYFQKRIWERYAPLWHPQLPLPFANGQAILGVLHNTMLLRNIEQAYRDMMETRKGVDPTLHDCLQDITNQLVADQEEEEFSALMFLAAKQGFVQKDFEHIQRWFHLDSLNDLEAAMKKVGLSCEQDLYDHRILIPKTQLSKNEIIHNLQRHIESRPKPRLTECAPKKFTLHFSLHPLKEKVMHVIYYAIKSGSLLVPVVISPYAGATGFVLGLGYFVMKRFGICRSQTAAIEDFTEEMVEGIPFGEQLSHLLSRRVFHINMNRRTEADQFAKADFFRRIQIINELILTALFVSHLTLRRKPSFLGGFCQGFFLADEVVN
jgi:hypothetical protein